MRFIIVFCLLISSVFNFETRKFPQNLTFQNSIKPQGANLTQDIIDYYEYWKLKYLKTFTIKNQTEKYFVFKEENNKKRAGISLSESLGYSLTISVLMAGYENNSQAIFNDLCEEYEANKISDNNYLMRSDFDDDTAHTGGNIQIAYSFLLAYYQWNNQTYLNKSILMINKGLSMSFIKLVSMRLGMYDDQESDIYSTRPADWTFAYFRLFKQVSNESVWETLTSNLYGVFKGVVGKYSSGTGLISDVVVGDPARPARPFEPTSDEGRFTGKYGYNSCRVPLNLMLDYAHYGSETARNLSEAIVQWARKKTKNNISKLKSGYTLGGKVIRDRHFKSAAFMAPVLAASVANSSNQEFLNNGWQIIKNMRENFYEDSVNLLSMLFISGNWWKIE